MRTTVTLDDDLALRIDQYRAERGQSFKEAINELIRIGFERHGWTVTRQSEIRRPLKTLDLGEPKMDLTCISAVLEFLDEEESRDVSG